MLPGNAHLIVLKVVMTHTYANKNEEQPRGFAMRIFKEYCPGQNKKPLKNISVCNLLFKVVFSK